jgi:muramoyltetrapeptide carboxypeptidase
MADRRIFPPPLRPGDRVAVVAPSSPFDLDALEHGLAFLRERYEVLEGASLRARAGYLAGSDDARAKDLADAMLDPRVRAIVAARGGYGAMRIVDRLPWDAWAARPSWIVGFSDVTALHACAWERGVASVHGPHVTGLGRGEGTAAWRAALEEPCASRAWSGLEVVHEGRAEGPLVGGNLALLAAMAAAGRLALPEGCVLALEDVTEKPYRVDRMMTSLRLGGHLARAGAIVLGGFTECTPGPDGVSAREVLRDLTRGVPVLGGAPFGHEARNDAFVLGAHVVVEGDAMRFTGA